jgi:hypothetical protein
MTILAQRILAVVLTGGLMLLILELVRRKRLMERYALLWLFSTAVLIVLAAWKGLLTTIASALGIHYPPALLFAVAFAFELLLLLHFSLTISRLADQNKVLAQRLGLVRQRVEEQEARLEQQEQQLSELRAQAGLESPGKPGPSERELSRVR